MDAPVSRFYEKENNECGKLEAVKLYHWRFLYM